MQTTQFTHPQPISPAWPTKAAIRSGFTPNGVQFEQFNEGQHLLSYEKVQQVRKRIEEYGNHMLPLRGGTDVSRLYHNCSVNSTHAQIHCSSAREVGRFIKELGTRYTFHVTDGFTFAVARGHWMVALSPRRQATFSADNLCEDYSMAAKPKWDNGCLEEHLGHRTFYNSLVNAGLQLPNGSAKAAHTPIVLAIDLTGYKHFRTNQEFYLRSAGGIVAAPCPPPPAFVKPICAVRC